MKNVFKIMGVVLITSLLFISCNKVKSLADVTFDADFEADLMTIIPPASTRGVAGTFDADVVINPASDPNIAKYLDKIKDYNINSMTGVITNISKDITLVSSTVSVFNTSNNASWTFSNLPLSLGSTLNLDNTNGQWNTIEQILKTGQEFTISMAGETDQDDVTFTVKITIQTEVTANPL